MRYFADTAQAGFAWETTPPSAAGVLNEQTMAKFAVDRTNLPGLEWEKLDYAKKPGLEFSTWYSVPEDGIYEFESEGALRVDGANVTRERNGLYGPLALQAGWHALLLRTTVENKDFNRWLLLRGGPFGKHTDLRLSWCAAPAAPHAPPAPAVTIARVGQAAFAGKPLPALTGTTVTLQATSSVANLHYAWCVVTAPPVGAVIRPDSLRRQLCAQQRRDDHGDLHRRRRLPAAREGG